MPLSGSNQLSDNPRPRQPSDLGTRPNSSRIPLFIPDSQAGESLGCGGCLQPLLAPRLDLFVWYGTAPSLDLQSWQRRRDLTLPRDLLLLWERTGGGDIFETETLVGPALDPREEWVDSFDDVNKWHRTLGLPRGFAIFQIGLCLSAVRLSEGKYTILEEDSYRVLREYETFDEWYERELRDEYANVFSLSGTAV